MTALAPLVTGTVNRFIVRNVINQSLIKVRHRGRRITPIEVLKSGETYRRPERVDSAAQVRKENDDDYVHRPISSQDLVRRVTPQTPKKKENASKNKQKSDNCTQFEMQGVNYFVPTRSKMSQLLSEEVMKARNKRKREEHRCVLVEGFWPLMHTLDSGAEVQDVFIAGKMKDFLEQIRRYSETRGKDSQRFLGDVTLYNMDLDLMKVYMFHSGEVVPHINFHTMATVKMPHVGEAVSPPVDPLPVTVVLDNITDLTVLGKLVRYITATRCKRLILLDNCGDIWDTRCMYSAVADHFRIPIYPGIPSNQLQNYIYEEEDGDSHYGRAVYVASSGHVLPTNKKNPEPKSRKSSEESTDGLKEEKDGDSAKKGSDPNVDYSKEDFSVYSDITLIISPTWLTRKVGRSFLAYCDGKIITLPVQPVPHCPSFSASVVLSEIYKQFNT